MTFFIKILFFILFGSFSLAQILSDVPSSRRQRFLRRGSPAPQRGSDGKTASQQQAVSKRKKQCTRRDSATCWSCCKLVIQAAFDVELCWIDELIDGTDCLHFCRNIVLRAIGWHPLSLWSLGGKQHLSLHPDYTATFHLIFSMLLALSSECVYSEHHIFFCKPTSGLPHLNCKQSLATFIGRSARFLLAISEFGWVETEDPDFQEQAAWLIASKDAPGSLP